MIFFFSPAQLRLWKSIWKFTSAKTPWLCLTLEKMPLKTFWFSTWTEGRTFSSPSLETTCPAALELHWKLCVAWRSPLERSPSPNSSIWLVKKSWAQTSDYAFNPIWTKTETVCFRISSRIFRALRPQGNEEVSDMRKDIIKNGEKQIQFAPLESLFCNSVLVWWHCRTPSFFYDVPVLLCVHVVLYIY